MVSRHGGGLFSNAEDWWWFDPVYVDKGVFGIEVVGLSNVVVSVRVRRSHSLARQMMPTRTVYSIHIRFPIPTY